MKTHNLLKAIFLLAILCFSLSIYSQTFGPNNPSSGTNNASVGAFAWTNPNNVLSSNNSHASNTNKGVTNYVSASNFGFAIPVTTNINGIQLDVEKSTLSPTIVTVLNNWSAGLTKSISAGTNRMLLFMASMENGSGARSITNLRYGGQAMTKIIEGVTGTVGGFQAKLEFWVLLESGITTATSTAFTATYNAVTLTENIEYYASAVYAGVDQILPYTSTQVFTTTATGATVTVSPTLATTGGGMAVAAIHCGNNTTPGSAIGGTNTFSVTNTFTETIDTYTANPSFGTSGMCTQIAHQAIASAGTVAPSYTFAGTPNRRVVIYVNLTCVAELDNSVRLVKGGTITGSNFAYTSSPWNTVDTYTSYGGASSLWGTTWSVAEVNATNFGAVISASVNNGTARVDHMRITIYGTSTLPIELIDFMVKPEKDYRKLIWRTASEKNNKEFIIERKSATSEFEFIGRVKGNENTTVLSEYNFIDDEILSSGIYYYRLKQIDFDNTFEYSPIVSFSQLLDDSEPVIYPNPSPNGLFNIELGATHHNEIQIYSSDLKYIKTLPADETKLHLSLQELSDGNYFIIFNLPQGQKIKQIQKICR